MNVFRIAEFNDVQNLVAINSKWQKKLIDDAKNGFLSVAYDDSLFTTIINRKEIAVGETSEKELMDYYLIYNKNEGFYNK